MTTTGTRTYAVLDGCNTFGGETDNGETQSKYLLSIKEMVRFFLLRNHISLDAAELLPEIVLHVRF